MRGRSNPRSRGKPRKPSAPPPADPHSLAAQMERYLEWLQVRAYSEATVANRRRDVGAFVVWCEARSVTRPPELSRLLLDLYQRYLAQHPKRDGTLLAPHTQGLKLGAVASFCKWLTKERLLLYNPASEIERPREGVRLPHTVLTAEETEKVLAIPDVTTLLGLRDRTIMETFYSTGIRRSELVHLARRDLDARRGVLVVRAGKGKKDRVVPVGERALAWLELYLSDVRPLLLTTHDDDTLFLTADGTPIAPNHLSELVRRTIDLADVGKRGSCHLLRHTMATLMLEGGADIRFIQQMLGHAKLDTTQIYTRVSIHALKAVHQSTHPGARLKRRANEHAEEQGEPCPPASSPSEKPAESLL